MEQRRTTFRMTLLAAVLAALIGCGDDTTKDAGNAKDTGANTGDKVLRFSAIPDQDPTELKEKFDAWARYLSKELGVKVEYVAAKDYAATVDMFRTGDIQLCWYGGLTGVQARHAVEGARAIAQGKEDLAYISYFIAHKDTGLTKSDDFPNTIGSMTFTFGSPQSTSGRLMPAYFIQQETGKSADDFFQHMPLYQKNHDQVIDAVRGGAVQVGVLNYAVYDKRVAADPSLADEARIIWVTPTYRDYNWTAHPALDTSFDKGFTDRLQAAIIAVKDENLLSAFPRSAMVKATNEEFDQLKAVAESLGFIR